MIVKSNSFLKTKNNIVVWIIPFFIIGIFLFQYVLIIDYFEDMFKYNSIEVRTKAIIREKQLFYFYILQNGITILLQFIGSLICLNIGFIYLNYKVPIGSIVKLIFKSFLAVLVIQLLVIILIKLSNKTFTTGTIVSIEEKFNLTSYININSIATWLELPLSTVNLKQILIIFILTLSIRSLIKLNLYKSFALTLKTYGAGLFLWFVFSMIMEMNFS